MPVQMSIKRLECPDCWGGQELVGMNSHDSAEIGSAAFCEPRVLSREFRGTARVALSQRRGTPVTARSLGSFSFCRGHLKGRCSICVFFALIQTVFRVILQFLHFHQNLRLKQAKLLCLHMQISAWCKRAL